MPPEIVTEPGKGPPKGSTSDYKGVQSIPFDTLEKMADGQLGGGPVDGSDPGFIPPHDPLATGGARARSGLIYRDPPLVTIQHTWDVDGIRGALRAHVDGRFDASAQLCDSIVGDDRVVATLGSRCTGLFGREVRFKPGNDSDAARECMDAWIAHWPKLFGDGSFYESQAYTILMGQSPSQLLWDTTTPVWGPYLRPWHQRYTYYHWPLRCLVALTLDGQERIAPGNGKWVLHAPYGLYRGWLRGAIRAVAEPWALRHFAFRDMGRFSEVHGMPTRIAEAPAAADPPQRAKFESDVANLGAETTLLLGKGVDEANSYGYKLVEATDQAWEVFPGMIDRCDMAIVLAIMFQNLTTEVKGGAFAATSAHMDVRQGGIQFDGTAWKNTIYSQIARAFAYLNFGDAGLAPWTEWDVAPREDYEYRAKQFQQFGTAIEVLRRGGVEFKDVEELRRFAQKCFGLDGLPDFKITEPVAGGGK